MILSLIDSNVTWVDASAEFNDKGVDVFTAALLKFENGIRASFNVGMIFEPGQDGRKDLLYIHGSKGIITSDVEFNQQGELCYSIMTEEGKIERRLNAKQNYSLEIEQLGRCIENGDKPYISEEFSMRNADLLDKILAKIGY